MRHDLAVREHLRVVDAEAEVQVITAYGVSDGYVDVELGGVISYAATKNLRATASGRLIQILPYESLHTPSPIPEKEPCKFRRAYLQAVLRGLVTDQSIFATYSVEHGEPAFLFFGTLDGIHPFPYRITSKECLKGEVYLP